MTLPPCGLCGREETDIGTHESIDFSCPRCHAIVGEDKNHWEATMGTSWAIAREGVKLIASINDEPPVVRPSCSACGSPMRYPCVICDEVLGCDCYTRGHDTRCDHCHDNAEEALHAND